MFLTQIEGKMSKFYDLTYQRVFTDILPQCGIMYSWSLYGLNTDETYAEKYERHITNEKFQEVAEAQSQYPISIVDIEDKRFELKRKPWGGSDKVDDAIADKFKRRYTDILHKLKEFCPTNTQFGGYKIGHPDYSSMNVYSKQGIVENMAESLTQIGHNNYGPINAADFVNIVLYPLRELEFGDWVHTTRMRLNFARRFNKPILALFWCAWHNSLALSTHQMKVMDWYKRAIDWLAKTDAVDMVALYSYRYDELQQRTDWIDYVRDNYGNSDFPQLPVLPQSCLMSQSEDDYYETLHELNPDDHRPTDCSCEGIGKLCDNCLESFDA